MHHKTFDRYIGYLMPKIEKVARKSVDLVREFVVKHAKKPN